MTDANDTPPEVRDRWRDDVVLKRDVFSTIERGRFVTPQGDVDAILRRLDQVPWWNRRWRVICSRASAARWR